jgi:hypothetical protein
MMTTDGDPSSSSPQNNKNDFGSDPSFRGINWTAVDGSPRVISIPGNGRN